MSQAIVYVDGVEVLITNRVLMQRIESGLVPGDWIGDSLFLIHGTGLTAQEGPPSPARLQLSTHKIRPSADDQ